LPPEIIPLVRSQSSTITVGGLIDAARQAQEPKQQDFGFGSEQKGR
jgi:hypothetical protein